MSEPGFAEDDFGLSRMRVAVVGLGLMGGSLGLALRGKCRERLGIDPDPAVLSLASQIGAADRLALNPAELLPEADLVVLAAPVCAVLGLLKDLPALHPGRAVVLDVGSTKVEITAAMQLLPDRFDPLGGHPICGKERSSLAEADPGLYCGKVFAFTPLARTTPRAWAAAAQMVEAIGAFPLWLDAETHDRWIAATSHAPYLLANTLAAVVSPEARPLVGPGYRSTTRVASTPLHIMLDILQTNRTNVLELLQQYRSRLELVEGFLASGNMAALRLELARGAENQARLLGIDLGETQ